MCEQYRVRGRSGTTRKNRTHWCAPLRPWNLPPLRLYQYTDIGDQPAVRNSVVTESNMDMNRYNTCVESVKTNYVYFVSL